MGTAPCAWEIGDGTAFRRWQISVNDIGTAVCTHVKYCGSQNYEIIHLYSFPTSTFEDFKANTEIFVPQHDVDKD